MQAMDTHLRPQIEDCDYCSIAYTYVAKTENFTNSLATILSQAGVPREFHVVTDFQKESFGRSAPSEISGAFSQLDGRLKQGVKDFYKLDFEMFGYDAEKYG